MDDKYYTPEIEEFKVGFIYEYKNPINKKWIPRIIQYGIDIQYMEINIRNSDIRVKYLDSDDIIDLGFEIANEDANTYKSIKKLRGLGVGDDKTLFVHHDTFRSMQGDIRINTHIWWRENRGTEITVFEGSIRNKSEFREILKRIHATNIITEGK